MLGLAPERAQANKISDEEPLSPEQIEELQSLGLPMLGEHWSEEHGGFAPGQIIEITEESKPTNGRKTRSSPQESENPNNYFPQIPAEDILAAREASQANKTNRSEPRSTQANDRIVEWGVIDAESGRKFRYRIDRERLRQLSKAAEPRLLREMDQSPQLSDEELAREEEVLKGWSDGEDNRVLKAMFTGHSKRKYGMIADYGYCTASVLKARSGYLWALTATHCVFPTNEENVDHSHQLIPRREFNEAPYGKWKIDKVIYDPKFFRDECGVGDEEFLLSCVQWDMALVRFKPGKGAKVPPIMRWGLRRESFLEERTKFRRGYPGCGVLGAPGDALNECKDNVLYGDGSFDIGASYYPNPDGWNRAIDYSSDSSHGDSGSGCFYINDDNRFTVFGIVSAGRADCYDHTCTDHTPSTMRRITPVWYDTISANL